MASSRRGLVRRLFTGKAAWMTGGLLFLVVSGVVGMLSGERPGIARTPHLVEIRINGAIMDPEATVGLLEKARERPGAKGVLLRVNSPGGGVGASQALYEAVRRLAREKPVAVSMGSVAASGGYMTALGGDRIFALDATLTGSIGVIMMSSGVHGLLDKVGVEPRIIKSGRYKDAGTPLRPMEPADRKYLQSMVDELHGQFVALVAQRRGLDPETVRQVADGRVFSGRQAKERGLVDVLGDRYVARDWLRQETGVSKEVPLKTLRPERPWLSRMMPEETESALRTLAAWLTPRPRFGYLYLG